MIANLYFNTNPIKTLSQADILVAAIYIIQPAPFPFLMGLVRFPLAQTGFEVANMPGTEGSLKYCF